GPTPRERVGECAKRLLDMGCDEVSLGDTSGVGTPHEVAALLDVVTRSVPIANVAMHFHDTYGQALANAHLAMSRGVRIFDTSTGGTGGSPFAKMAGGNLATEDLLWLCRGGGIATGVDLDANVRRAGGSDRREEIHEIGPQPLFVGVARALVRPRPAAIFEARGRRDALPRVLQLRDVLRLRLEHAAREAVRGEEHERIGLR